MAGPSGGPAARRAGEPISTRAADAVRQAQADTAAATRLLVALSFVIPLVMGAVLWVLEAARVAAEAAGTTRHSTEELTRVAADLHELVGAYTHEASRFGRPRGGAGL